jgi:hypothetical protein
MGPERRCRAASRLANDAVVTEDEPHPAIKLRADGTSWYRRQPQQSCYERAIHSSPERSRADNHGQQRCAPDLRGSSSSQVTILHDLALGAGGRLVRHHRTAP